MMHIAQILRRRGWSVGAGRDRHRFQPRQHLRQHAVLLPMRIQSSDDLSASPTATASSQLPACPSGTPGACQRLGCVGHFCMCLQLCLMSAEGGPVLSAINTVTPSAKASVSTVASPLCRLPHESVA